MLVLDEADSMVGKDGHIDTVKKIVRIVDKGRTAQVQKVLFSATYNDQVWTYACNQFAPGARKIQLQAQRADQVLKSVKQLYVRCNGAEEKIDFIRKIFSLHALQQCIIFANTKGAANRLHSTLVQGGFTVKVTHSGLDKACPDGTCRECRPCVLKRFENQEFNVLISTNVIARGIDIPKINMVINYDLPTGRDGKPQHEEYLHRVGRASRYGRYGMSFNLISSPDEKELQDQIQEYWQGGIAGGIEVLDVKVSDLVRGDDATMEKLQEDMEKFMTEGNTAHPGNAPQQQIVLAP